MKLLLRFFQVFFGCHHQQLSRVFTIKARTYHVCLECGQEFERVAAGVHPDVHAEFVRQRPIRAVVRQEELGDEVHAHHEAILKPPVVVGHHPVAPARRQPLDRVALLGGEAPDDDDDPAVGMALNEKT